jgi:hypothetical protein
MASEAVIRRAAALPLLCLLAGCNGDAPGQWAAIVWPDGGDRSHFATTYRFQSAAACRQAAAESIAALPDPRKADYRCGYQCEPDPRAPGHPLCKSTTK